MRANAQQWLELAEKVQHYRRDRLDADDLRALGAQIGEVRQLVKDKADRMKLKLAIESLESVLRSVGGTHYPKSTLVENVEFFLVAAIVILGFRAYFIQPFKIPTNSMWPSYYGMTVENFPPDEHAPGLIGRGFRLLAFGAQRREMSAPRSGTVSADFQESGELAYTLKPGRSWFVFPTTVREYTFYVDGEPTHVTVPQDFQGVDQAMRETFFGDDDGFAAYLRGLQQAGTKFERRLLEVYPSSGRGIRVFRVPLGRQVGSGAPILRFDVMTGDQLFVDRMSYHFVQPKVGQGFVFRTGKIDNPYMKDRTTGRQIDQYYIKRLVGEPGDKLEIKDFGLYRNGEPITGAAAFQKNAKREDHYIGYRNELGLDVGKTMTVPADHYMALGDNSANSQDSRYWGYVPAAEVVGRPLVIYYPFTKRWGPSR
jgi:signal peptidase I